MPETGPSDGLGRGGLRQALLLALVFLVLNGRALDWGLPSSTGWAPDEVLPGDVVRGLESGFGGGWHERYPPLHYRVLGLVDGLILRLRDTPAHNPLPEPVHSELALAGRLVSLLMGAGTVALVSLCAGRLYGARAGALAALLVTGMPTLGFHARLATLDVPYLFWWSLSLWFGLRAFSRPGWAEWLGYGLAAAAAVATKDQAYGLYLLSWPAWIWLLNRRAPVRAAQALGSLTAAGWAFAVAHRLVANASGFRSHLSLVLGPASQPFQAFSRDLPGMLGLVDAILGQLSATLGWPAFCLALGAVGWAVARRLRGEELFMLASGASYVLTFLLAILYVYDRFVLPLGILLAVFAAGLLERGLGGRVRWQRGLARALVGALVGLAVARALSTADFLAHDTRYAAESWLLAHTPAGERLGLVGAWRDLPRGRGLRVRSLPPEEPELLRLRPLYVVCNLDKVGLVRATDREAPFFARLQSGQLGYELAWRWRTPVSWLMRADLEALSGRSNLSWASPEIAIYRRRVAAQAVRDRRPVEGRPRRALDRPTGVR